MKNKVEKIEILVHRGAGACSTLRKLNINVNAKDNSKKAFECAIENGYNLVETDVKYFNRSKILVTHDKVKLTKNRKSRTKKEFTKISNQLLLDEPSSKNNFSGNKPPQHTENNPLFVNELNNYKNKLKFNVELKRCLKRHSSIFVDIFLDTISIDILHSISTFDNNIYFELIKHKKVVENKICVFYIVDNQSFGKFCRMFIKNHKKDGFLQHMNVVFNCNILDMMKEHIPKLKNIFLYGVELNQPEFYKKLFDENKNMKLSGLIIDDLMHFKAKMKKYEDFFVF